MQCVIENHQYKYDKVSLYGKNLDFPLMVLLQRTEHSTHICKIWMYNTKKRRRRSVSVNQGFPF